MKTKLILAASVAVLLASSPSWAEGHSKGPMCSHNKMMEKMDKDGDGSVSKAEFMLMQEERFTENDSDADGLLSADEMKAAWEKKHEKMKEKHGNMKEGMHKKMQKTQIDSSSDSEE